MPYILLFNEITDTSVDTLLCAAPGWCRHITEGQRTDAVWRCITHRGSKQPGLLYLRYGYVNKQRGRKQKETGVHEDSLGLNLKLCVLHKAVGLWPPSTVHRQVASASRHSSAPLAPPTPPPTPPTPSPALPATAHFRSAH